MDIIQAWMNEFSSSVSTYDPDDFHISTTKSVLVELERTELILKTPKKAVPRRAVWNDPPITNAAFIKHREFDLYGSQLSLLPAGLVRKRLWSKKYPLCITLSKTGVKKVAQSSSSDSDSQQLSNSPTETSRQRKIILFARTNREKEEWYRRLQAATSGTPIPTTLNEMVAIMRARRKAAHKSSLHFETPEVLQRAAKADNVGRVSELTSFVANARDDDSVATIEVDDVRGSDPETPVNQIIFFLNFMSRVMPADATSGTVLAPGTTTEEKEECQRIGSELLRLCDDSTLWMNALVSRLFMDFMRLDVWAERIKTKIERKVQKIHVSPVDMTCTASFSCASRCCALYDFPESQKQKPTN